MRISGVDAAIRRGYQRDAEASAARRSDEVKRAISDFEAATLAICARLLPHGFDVADDAPSTLQAITAYHVARGRLCVWSGASERTIFSNAAANWAFRAWHDWRHLTTGGEFTPEGERRTMVAQGWDLARYLWRRPRTLARCLGVLFAEVQGQLEHQAKWGEFPRDQRYFVRLYLAHGPRIVELFQC